MEITIIHGQMHKGSTYHITEMLRNRLAEQDTVMMDKKVIWYGGMDLLSDKYGNESIICIKNETLANEMIGVLLKENQYD